MATLTPFMLKQDCINQNCMISYLYDMKYILESVQEEKKGSFSCWLFFFIFLLYFTAIYRQWISNYCESNSHNRWAIA